MKKNLALTGISVLAASLASLPASHARAPASIAEPEPQKPAKEPSETTFKPYGFLLATYDFASAAVSSFGSTNQVAPTAAQARSSDSDRYSRSSLHVAQSRIGTNIVPSEKLRGKIEFDFVDFAKSSTTVASYPRLRIAKIEYLVSDANTLFFGQDWDIFSPLNPHTYNPVSNNFQSGNSGFMRQQFGILRKSAGYEAAAALGLPGTNNNPSDADLELSKVPTVSGRYNLLWNGHKLGVSAIATRITHNRTFNQSRGVYGFTLHGEFALTPRFALRGEGYTGQGLGSIGSLTLAQSRANASLREAGGWLSFKWGLGEVQNLYGGLGIASILNDAEVLAPSATANGIQRNRALRLGYDRKFEEKLSWFLEATYFSTRYQSRGTFGTYLVGSGFMLSI